MTEVVMPQMGESIAEGHRPVDQEVGDRVDRDERCSRSRPTRSTRRSRRRSAGVLMENQGKGRETVPVNSVVAVIGEAGAVAAAPAARGEDGTCSGPVAPARPVPPIAPVAPLQRPRRLRPAPAPTAAVPAPQPRLSSPKPGRGQKQKSSPLVRRIPRNTAWTSRASPAPGWAARHEGRHPRLSERSPEGGWRRTLRAGRRPHRSLRPTSRPSNPATT